MRKWQQPAEYTGIYPNGWAGYTFLDYDSNYNVFHPGEDLNWTAGGGGNEDLGRDVWAIQDGKVVHTSSSSTGYGNMVVLEHVVDADERALVKKLYAIDAPVLYSLYAHLNSINIANGIKVTKGQKIATIGKSGTPWAHLHYELYAPVPNTDWRFYPAGWTKEQVKRYYLPVFNFIEETKKVVTPTPPPVTDKRPYYFDLINKSVWNKPHEQVTETEVKKFAADYPSQLTRSGKWDSIARLAGITGDTNTLTPDSLFKLIQSSSPEAKELRQKIKTIANQLAGL